MSKDWPGWPTEDAERYQQAGWWAGETFSAALHRWAARRPDHVAVVDHRRRLTYADLVSESEAVAAGLAAHGVGPGDRVILQLPNVAEFLTLWFALQHLGAVPVHAMPAHRTAELEHLADLADARAYVTTDVHQGFDHRELADHLVAARAQAGRALLVVVVGEVGDRAATGYDQLRTADGADRASGVRTETSSRDLALLLLSGGTTGLPKLIPRTHDDYLYNARLSAERCGMTPDTVFLAALPVAFNFSWCCPGALGTLSAGGTVVLARDPSPDTVFDLIVAERVTSLTLNPPLAGLFVEEIGFGGRDTSSVEVVNVGSARLPDDVAVTVGPAFGATLQQVYGMAEGLICYTHLDDPEGLVTTTQGVPMSPGDEVRVVDGEGRDVAAGEPGELLTRGPYTLRGYWRADEHNAVAFTPDGYYRTGDLVRRLETGHLIVVGRVKDQINRGGEKIAPAEVEGHLVTHPQVDVAAVFGVPDPLYGERVAAAVRPVPGQGEPDPATLVAHLRERGLAAYKVPERFAVVDDMPLTAVAKIDKAALRERVTRQ
ncbi:(2,3-dihydroxybenzoyl)adenylate synthase [Isoptericola croceus]|uniref:(2,3-dihydroxybenzoyl)adenylate synthase n=1 Tax=Isoptericola croceus TaxID=3031406 RepID=UPI0023F64290|nr:AMP-binding protein [Isoptericola croceus]